MKPYRILLSLLVFLLLSAQQAAYAHAVTHLGKEPTPKEQLAHAKLCGKCVGFEKISGAAPFSAPGLPALPLPYVGPASVRYAFSPSPVFAFQGRAPPASL